MLGLNIERLVVLAPNWLGDAVMALPVLEDLRRAFPDAHLAVAARRSVSGLFSVVSGIDHVLQLDTTRDRTGRHDARDLRLETFDTALLLPNSFRAAWLVRRASIPHRWGYGTDGRSWLLTKSIAPSVVGHQTTYYQHLIRELGIPPGDPTPRIDIPDQARRVARARLREKGYDEFAPLIVLAPGAAYGSAKRWPTARVGDLVTALVQQRLSCVLVGSHDDAPTRSAILDVLPLDARHHVIDLIGQTTLEELAAVLSIADVCVSNDSGALHLAAAVGAPVVAIFGPTNERVTAPVARTGTPAALLTNPVWCRPCMLRECPIDHSCMTGIASDVVFDAVSRMLQRGRGGLRSKAGSTSGV